MGAVPGTYAHRVELLELEHFVVFIGVQPGDAVFFTQCLETFFIDIAEGVNLDVGVSW